MQLPTTFKAWTYAPISGRLENSLSLVDVPFPEHFRHPPHGTVLVEVLANGLNPSDYKIPESPIESRVVSLRKPASPCMDFCGRVVSKPERVVFGRLAWPNQYGTLGQYILVSERDFADVPEDMDYTTAAAMPIAALTAYQSLRPYVKPGDQVLINGGSGGVGTFTVQIAKLLGCHVVTSCSSRNADLCRQLGADEVVDYTQGDLIVQLKGRKFNLLIDNVGSDPSLHRRASTILHAVGRFVLVSAMLGSFRGIVSMIASMVQPRILGGARNKFSLILCQPNKAQLEQLAAWVSAGKLRVVIDEIFSFEDGPSAIAKLRTGRARGKIVVRGVSK